LPKKHVYRVNPDGSLGSEIPEERALNEPILRDIQLDVLMSVQAAEALKNSTQLVRPRLRRAIAPLSAEIARVGAVR
jgi:hypothetical protein